MDCGGWYMAAGKHMSPLDELVSREEEADGDGERDWAWLQDSAVLGGGVAGAETAPRLARPPWNFFLSLVFQ
jgi:hypothetical protein